jgi:hypothetical protein
MFWILTPKKTQTLARFEAPDPWNGGRLTRFTLDRCFDGGPVPDYSAFDDDSIPHRYAIKSANGDGHRALPDSLAGLWREKKVHAEQLPSLLHRMEPTLRRSDYFRLMTMNRLQRGIRLYGMKYGAALVGAISALIGLALCLVPPPDRDPVTGVAMLLVAVPVFIVPGRFVHRWQTRRSEQAAWALRELARPDALALGRATSPAH